MSRVQCILAGLILAFMATTASAANLAIVGAKVYPSPDAQPIPDAVVLIEDGRIKSVGPRAGTSIPSGYEVMDRSGDVVTAGYWNSHIHLVTPELLRPDSPTDEALTGLLQSMFTRWGFTTVFDLASTMESANKIRKRISSAHLPAPKILTVGEPFYPKGGTPVYAVEIYRKFHLPSAEIVSTEKAIARVRKQVDEGADGVKLFTGAVVGGEIGVLPMPSDQVRAIAAEAHRLHRPVFAHPSNQAGLDVAVDNGVDILAHTAPEASPWTPAYVKRLKSRGIALIPTLTLFKTGGLSEALMDVILQQVKAMADGGGDILFGTDAGFIDIYDTTEEFRLMGTVLDWRKILASLTTAPATRFGQPGDRGRVEAGQVADIVILAGDPATDVTAFARVCETIRAGKIIYRRDRVQP